MSAEKWAGTKDMTSTITSLTHPQKDNYKSWRAMSQSLYNLNEILNGSEEGGEMTNKLVLGGFNYVYNIQNISPESFGYDVGYVSSQYALLEAPGFATKLFSFNLNGGSGLTLQAGARKLDLFYSANKLIGRAETPFAYVSKNRILRLERDVIQNNMPPTWHYHSAKRASFSSNRAFRKAAGIHKSLNRKTFGMPIGYN